MEAATVASANPDVTRVFIADTTIRDEHLLVRNGALLTNRQRSAIWRSPPLGAPKRTSVAHQLAELGVDVIEAGFARCPDQLAALNAVASEFQNEGPVVSAVVRTLIDEELLTGAWEAVSAAARPRLHLYTDADDLVDRGGHFRRPPRQLLDTMRATVTRARLLTDQVEFSPPRTDRASIDIAAEWTQAAIEAGATIVNVRTTAEYAEPEGFRAILLDLLRLAPASDSVVVSADVFVPRLRGRDALAAALGCAEIAIKAGCRQLKCAFHGIAGTPGHVPLELLVFNIWLRKQLGESQLWTNVDPKQLPLASEHIAAAKGLDLPAYSEEGRGTKLDTIIG